MNIDNTKIEKKMNIHASQYNFNKYESNSNLIDSEYISEYIHNNLYTMNFHEKINLYKKILSESKINRQLLKFELSNYTPKKKINNLKDMIKNVSKILARYHKMAGGDFLEDDEWILHEKGSFKYDLRSNEAIFENSICNDNRDCKRTYTFIKNMVNLIGKMSSKYIIKFKYLPDPSERIYWIIIKISIVKKPKLLKKKKANKSKLIKN